MSKKRFMAGRVTQAARNTGSIHLAVLPCKASASQSKMAAPHSRVAEQERGYRTHLTLS